MTFSLPAHVQVGEMIRVFSREYLLCDIAETRATPHKEFTLVILDLTLQRKTSIVVYLNEMTGDIFPNIFPFTDKEQKEEHKQND